MKTQITVILTTVLILSAPLYSNTITMNYTGLGATDIIQIWGGGWNGGSVYAGSYLFNKTAGTGEGQYINNGKVGVFCIDLMETIQGGDLTYDVIMAKDGPKPTTFLGSGMGQAKGDYLAELWSRYYDPAWSSGGDYTAEQRSNSAAFAASVWEIVNEELPTTSLGWDVTTIGSSGNIGFKAANVNSDLANMWLHSLTGTGPRANLRALSYTGSQDFITVLNNPDVPEPATVAFMATGLMMITRKRK